MKFQIGDRVLVLHSEEEGEVVDIINNKMVMVDVRGVKFPAYIDQLDFPYFKRFSEKEPVPKEGKRPKKYIDEVPREKQKPIDKGQEGIWLTFIPVMETDEFGDEIVEDLKIHLVNRTGKTYLFKYLLEYGGKEGFVLNNQLNAYQDFYIHDMPFENVNDGPAFRVEFQLDPPEKNKAPFFETNLRLKPKPVFTKIQEIRQKGEATFSYRILESYPDKQVEEPIPMDALINKGYKIYPAAAARQHLEPAKQEIDLHIEKLSTDSAHLSSFEKLTLQLQTFEKYLDLAIAHHQPTFIAIHGVGTGKLRDEIHEILQVKREVKSFINRYHPAYGYGATEIFLQY